MLATTDVPPGMPMSPARLSAWVKRKGPTLLVCDQDVSRGTLPLGQHHVVRVCEAAGKQALACDSRHLQYSTIPWLGLLETTERREPT